MILSSSRKAIVPLILAVIPGWGHIWVQRPTRGLLLFIPFFGLLNIALMGLLEPVNSPVKPWVSTALALAAALYVFSFLDTIRITIWVKSRRVQKRRSRLLWKAQVHYLKGEHGQATESLQRMLRIHPHDVTALMYSGLIRRDSGDSRAARAAWKKALAHDHEKIWETDIVRLLANLSLNAAVPSHS